MKKLILAVLLVFMFATMLTATPFEIEVMDDVYVAPVMLPMYVLPST